MAKKSRSNRKESRKNRKASRKNRRTNRRSTRRMMYGGESIPASVGGNPMKEAMEQSLRQGQQFAGYHMNQHGGAALEAGPFPGAVIAPSILPQDLHASARVAPLDAAYKQIAGLRDQDGGARRNRKNRKGSRKNRKVTRKNRKANRKSRRSNARRNRRGGAYSLADAQSVKAPGMLLSPEMEAKAVSGMNAEWRLAENPKAFAPGYAQSA